MKTTISYILLCLYAFNADSAITEINNTSGSGVYADQSGNLYVWDVNVKSVTMIEASFTCSTAGSACLTTQILDEFGDGMGNLLDRPSAVAVDSNGHIYVAGQFSDNVFRILNPKICIADCIREVVDSSGVTVNGLDTPVAITVDTNDHVYVAGAASDNVLRIAASETCATTGTPCTVTEIIDLTGDDGAGVNEMNQPVGLASDSQNSVFVTSQNSDNVFKIASPTGCSTTSTPCIITEIIDESSLTASAFGRGIVVDGQDNVFMTSLGVFEPAAVFKINTPGTCSTSGTNCIISEIYNMATPQQAGNMTVDDAGSVYFTGGNGDNAFKIDTPDNCSTTTTPCNITEIIDATGDGTAILEGTSNMAFALGDIYVSGGSSDNVFRITDVAVSGDLIFQNGFE